MRVFPAVVVGAVLVASGGAARAQAATCDIPIVNALHNGDDGRAPNIDPDIKRLKPYFEKAPFTAWRDFKLLDRKELSIPEGGSSSFALPNGREATLTFISHQAGPGDHRMRLRLSIDDKSGKKGKMLDTTFVLDEGGVVLHAGQKHQGGILILAVSCKTAQ